MQLSQRQRIQVVDRYLEDLQLFILDIRNGRHPLTPSGMRHIEVVIKYCRRHTERCLASPRSLKQGTAYTVELTGLEQELPL